MRTWLHVALLVGALVLPPAAAQDNLSGSVSRSGQNTGQSQAKVAQAGAGTTDGTTNGSSGPSASSGPPGNTELPPLPGPELCKDFEGTEAYADCLLKVLGPKGATP